MSRSPLSLQKTCLKYVIDRNLVSEVLNPYIWDEDFDMSTLVNDRLSYEEKKHYTHLAATGQMTVADCKDDLYSLLYRRPFDLDLKLLREIPMLNVLNDYQMRQIWAESIVDEWENYLPAHLGGLRAWDELTMTWDIYNSLLDGCTSSWLFEVLEEERQLLIKADQKNFDEHWRKNIGCDWLSDMSSIDK